MRLFEIEQTSRCSHPMPDKHVESKENGLYNSFSCSICQEQLYIMLTPKNLCTPQRSCSTPPSGG